MKSSSTDATVGRHCLTPIASGPAPARLLLDPPGKPAWNMAVDESLLQLAEWPVLRMYSWSMPAVSLGYFQPVTVVPPGRPYVRRYTGGGLVDHARDFTYSLAAPRCTPLGTLSTADSYALIHRSVALALQELDLQVELCPGSSESEAPGCFQKPVKFDLLLDGQKVAGAAQRRTRQAVLHQGSILLPDSSFYPALREIFPRCLARELFLTWQIGQLTAQEAELATQLEQDRYSQAAWNAPV